MRIDLITPAAKGSRSGNRVTAVRWAGLLRELGHRVRVNEPLTRNNADLLVAVHAYRSAVPIATWRQMYPNRPLVALLAGTDIYRFQHSHPATTLASMDVADRLVGLHDRVADDIPVRLHNRLRIIHQSAKPLPSPPQPSRRTFDICVIGHLREEKDPLRAAHAVRALPQSSLARIVHLGKAHDANWAEAAATEMVNNSRYHWRGEVSHGLVRRCLARCHAMVISSVMEGGANVVSEAIVAGLPILASRIAGNVGLLGAEYPAYFPPRDSSALAQLIWHIESDPVYLAEVRENVIARQPLFCPARERAAWKRLLTELT